MFTASHSSLQRLAETQFAASEVIMRRLAQFYAAPFTAETQRETYRMVAEKQQAAAEAAMTFSMTLMGEAWEFWSTSMVKPWHHWSAVHAMEKAFGRAATPVTSRVRANHRRLRAKKLSGD